MHDLVLRGLPGRPDTGEGLHCPCPESLLLWHLLEWRPRTYMGSSSVRPMNFRRGKQTKFGAGAGASLDLQAEAPARSLDPSSIWEAALRSGREGKKTATSFTARPRSGFTLRQAVSSTALDPPCLAWNPNWTTHCLYDLGEVSDPLSSLFLSSKMGMNRVPGASCLTHPCLGFLIYEVEMIVAFRRQLGR